MARIHINHMVCDRCITAVRQLFQAEGLEPMAVDLGVVQLEQMPGEQQLATLSDALAEQGFEIVEDRRNRIVAEIKRALITYLKQMEQEESTEKLSDFIADRLHYNYSYLSNLFSEKTGETIEAYFIALRIERVKELLQHDQLQASEIAWRLNFSSSQHLSRQFKKVTGITITEFRKESATQRKGLDL